MNSNQKKAFQLGMPQGTAQGKLRKSIMFMLLKLLNLNFCHQCGSEIESEKDLSVEHKTPWLDSNDPIKTFFDLQNIAFSHLKCNISAAKRDWTLNGLDDPRMKHGNSATYRNHKCRCEKCTQANTEEIRNFRDKTK